MIKELDVKYPYIVLAQSILETGHWTSIVFKENHNLFGMKMANKRIKTAKGTQLNHAYYNNWQESVYDYAFYQCRYLSKINSEQEYYDALDATYAEAFKYSEKLKEIIKNEKLKEIFYHE
jgi:flagellum-specific peptidoglycan hydrolase FlgJ